MNLPYLNEIVCGDAKVLLSEFPSECIDLVVTSPPYDKIRTYNGFEFDFENIAKELARTLKQGGVIVWVVGDQVINGSESGTSFRQALYFMSLGLNLHDTMIYEKNGASFPSRNRYYQIFEYMFILSKGKPKTTNLLKDRRNTWGGSWGARSRRDVNGVLVSVGKITNDEIGIRFNIWRYNTGRGFQTRDEIAYQHPAIFPEALARDHILSWSNVDDVVLDPMCGSGTTCKMAQETGRTWIGFDISQEYVDLARERMNSAKVPLPT